MGIKSATGAGDWPPIPVPTVLTNIMNALPHPISTIITSSVCTYVLLTDRSLWVWGDNAVGAIGIGTELNYWNTTSPFAWDWGPGELLVQLPVQILPGVTWANIYTSTALVFFVYAQTTDGTMYSWGRNKGGILSNGIVSCGN